MSEELQTWISNKKFQISDKIDGISHQNNGFVVFKNEFFKTSEIKVFHSNQSKIDSIVTNSSINTTNNTNVLKWFNDIKFRKEVLQRLNGLLNESTKVLEFIETISTKTSVKISRNRIQNLLKTFLFSINNEIFENSNQYNFKSIEYSIIKIFKSQSFLLKAIHEIIGCLVRGIPLVLVVEDESALFASYFIDLCEKGGLQSGVIDLVIVDNKTALKLNETTKPTVCPIFVVFESADIESSIDRIINSLINDTIGSLNVFVQQSVYKKFCERMKTRLINSLEIGDRFDANVDIVSKININYDAIDFDNENNSYGIQVFKFRTNDEIKSLINHFSQIPYISLWTEKTSLGLEFAKIVDSSQVLLINSSLRYPAKTNVSVLDKVSDKIEFNQIYEQKSIESLIDSYKKWKSISAEERLRIIKTFLISNEISISVNPSNLNSFNQKIVENKDNYGIQLVITYFEPIGLQVITTDKEFNQRSLTLILEALISGNVLVINGAERIEDLIKLKEYLRSLGQNCLNFVNFKVQQKENAILTISGKSIGLYLTDFPNISGNSLIKTSKSITLSMGDISFAK